MESQQQRGPEGQPLMDNTSPTSPGISPQSASFQKGKDGVLFTFPESQPNSPELDTQCGAGKWRPDCLQPCANIRAFTAVTSITALLNGIFFAYYNAVITSIENRFGLSSSIMGFVKNADNIGFILSIVLVSHFCRYANKPRLFAACSILSSIATFLFALPHFIYGAGDYKVDQTNQTYSYHDKFTHFCDPDNPSDISAYCGRQNRLGQFNAVALALFITSEILQGVSNAPGMSLSVTYMDDNSSAQDSPKYFGWMFATRALSPLIGYGLGAWATSMYVDLQGMCNSTLNTLTVNVKIKLNVCYLL